MNRICCLGMAIVLSSSLFAQSKLIRVPQDKATIQAAIDSAANGDTVLVSEGTFVENVVMKKKIVVASLFVLDGDTSHISKTIIDGGSPSHADSASVVRFAAGTDTSTVLIGFTITHGTGSQRLSGYPEFLWWRVGGGIYVEAGGARILHNIIIDNSVGGSRCVGGGINVWDPTNSSKIGVVVIESNIIRENDAEGPAGYGGGLGFANGLPIVRNNIISRNFASAGGGAIDLGTGSLILVNNTIVNNQALGGPPGILSWSNLPRLLNNIIWNPGNNVDFVGAADLAYNNLIRGGSFVESNHSMLPSFEDTVSFSLSTNSPCVSAGEDSMLVRSIKLYAPAVDIYGNPRPNPPGSKPDLGAVESSAQSSNPPIESPQLFSKTLNSRGTTRSYVLFLPKNYNSLPSLPLVIFLHGCGGNPINAMTIGMQNIADTAGFGVVYPKSMTNCWVDNVNGTDSSDVNFVSDLIDTMLNYRFDPKRVYVCGFSSGAFLTFRLASEIGHRLAAVAPVSGGLPNVNARGSTPSSIPLALFFGTSDGIYQGGTAYQNADSSIIKWLSYNGCQPTADTVNIPDSDPTDGTTAKLIRYQSCVSGYPVYFYKILGGGHNWPGSPNGQAAFNRDVYASVEIWNFFKNYPIVSVREISETRPSVFAVSQNYPNPFNPSTKIGFKLQASGFTSLRIFDLLGHEVATLVNEELRPGSYETTWDAAGFPSGTYFYTLTSGAFTETKKLLLLK
ncbi:MAG TPA: PHB depolymerase family esterase [Bacteroidota bacterium]|nr:PHB depolymerase family esterase [Bacteroidota bacterium]